jgi:tetratricopeptide (TPR) repeat protein
VIWKKAVALAPDDASVQNDLAANLYINGDTDAAIDHLREAVRLNPLLVHSHYNLGAFLMQQGHPDQALPELQTTLSLDPRFPSAEEALADVYGALGKDSDALQHWRKALAQHPNGISILVGATRVLASSQDGSVRNGAEAVTLGEKANTLTSGGDPTVLDTLAAAYAEAGEFPQAVASENRALGLINSKQNAALAEGIRYRMQLYEANKPFRK